GRFRRERSGRPQRRRACDRESREPARQRLRATRRQQRLRHLARPGSWCMFGQLDRGEARIAVIGENLRQIGWRTTVWRRNTIRFGLATDGGPPLPGSGGADPYFGRGGRRHSFAGRCRIQSMAVMSWWHRFASDRAEAEALERQVTALETALAKCKAVA